MTFRSRYPQHALRPWVYRRSHRPTSQRFERRPEGQSCSWQSCCFPAQISCCWTSRQITWTSLPLSGWKNSCAVTTARLSSFLTTGTFRCRYRIYHDFANGNLSVYKGNYTASLAQKKKTTWRRGGNTKIRKGNFPPGGRRCPAIAV